MAPVGSRESLAAAIQAGADSVYFGIGKLNMRSHSANHFTIDDLREIAATCNEHGIKTYLTVNTVIYDNDIPTMKEIIDAAKEAGISAVIASDAVTDNETGNQLEIDNKYVMSPKDLKTIRFIDRMMDAGVRVFKIEGRARGPEYVYTVVKCYKEAIAAVLDGTFTEEKKDEWDEKLATVFNRGFWDGYYQGQTLGEWNKHYGSVATEKKVLVGKVMKYFSKLGVAEVAVEASTFDKGEKLLITGNTTGVMYLHADEIRYDLKPVETAQQGWRVSIPVPDKVRPNDKLYKLITVNEIKEIK